MSPIFFVDGYMSLNRFVNISGENKKKLDCMTWTKDCFWGFKKHPKTPCYKQTFVEIIDQID